jgi:hypothetical protein
MRQVTIVNDDSRVVTKLETSLTDDAQVFCCLVFVGSARSCPNHVDNL